jgi:hypothetical protein
MASDKRQRIVELHSFVELYKILHSDQIQSNDNTCWIMKGVGYANAQAEIAKYLYSILKNAVENNNNTAPTKDYSANNDNVTEPKEHSPQPAQSPPLHNSSPSPHSQSPPSLPLPSLPHPLSVSTPLSPQPLIFEWDAYDLSNFRFWGCRIPPGIFSSANFFEIRTKYFQIQKVRN